jgi:hypothetical protein
VIYPKEEEFKLAVEYYLRMNHSEFMLRKSKKQWNTYYEKNFHGLVKNFSKFLLNKHWQKKKNNFKPYYKFWLKVS